MSARNTTPPQPPALNSHTAAIRASRIQADMNFYNKAEYDRSRYSDDIAAAARLFLVAFRNSLVCTPEAAAAEASAASSEVSAEKAATANTAPGGSGGGASRGTKRPAAGKASGGATKKKKRAAIVDGSDTSSGKGGTGRSGGNSSIPPGSEVACRVKEDGVATWILATVRRYASESKKYEVMDSGEEEGRKTHMVFKKHIKVLSKKGGDFDVGTRVLAVYPDTTTYYAAVVKSRKSDSYVLVFDDEEEEEAGIAKEVRAQHVFVE